MIIQGIANRSSRFGSSLLFYSFAIIFIYFGIQKPLPIVSPPEPYINYLATQAGFSPNLIVNLVGFYEIFLGLIFLAKRIKLAFWPFLVHQLTTFLVLFLIPFSVFTPPWIVIHGIEIPIFLGSFSAFIFKNLVFITGFLLLLSIELN